MNSPQKSRHALPTLGSGGLGPIFMHRRCDLSFFSSTSSMCGFPVLRIARAEKSARCNGRRMVVRTNDESKFVARAGRRTEVQNPIPRDFRRAARGLEPSRFVVTSLTAICGPAQGRLQFNGCTRKFVRRAMVCFIVQRVPICHELQRRKKPSVVSIAFPLLKPQNDFFMRDEF